MMRPMDVAWSDLYRTGLLSKVFLYIIYLYIPGQNITAGILSVNDHSVVHMFNLNCIDNIKLYLRL